MCDDRAEGTIELEATQEEQNIWRIEVLGIMANKAQAIPEKIHDATRATPKILRLYNVSLA